MRDRYDVCFEISYHIDTILTFTYFIGASQVYIQVIDPSK